MNWKQTNEFRWLIVNFEWECLVEPEHDSATGYIAEEWRDVPTVTEESK